MATVLDVDGDFFTTFNLKLGPVIGSGMSGQVVLATHANNPRIKWAVKLFPLLTGSDVTKTKKLFTREVKCMQTLDHPNVIKLLLAARCPDRLVICTPYCQRGSLSSRLTSLSPAHLALYVIQLTSAVGYLQEKRIVHSDIKPSNVFIDDRQNAILGDFGVAFVVPTDQTTVHPKMVGGTPAFMAPELFGRCHVDPFKLDVYSLGVVIWCILFRLEPSSENLYDYLHEVNVCPDVPQPYRSVLNYILVKFD